MRKILVAYGPRGRSTDNGRLEQNWANPNEPVNSTGVVCCGNPICACSTSFTGITSQRKVTRAVVAEVPDEQYAEMLRMIYANSLAKFALMPGITHNAAAAAAQFRHDSFAELSDGIAGLHVNTIVRINKDRDGKRYDLRYTNERALT
jgi:hypothetical protein